MKRIEKLFVGIIILLVGIFVIILGMKKVNYHCDEIWTYGLSNNIGGINPSFKIGTEYQGMGPFTEFTIVQEGEQFNYANTWENQAKDVHPPFYYLLIHTVCSIFKGRYSKWYGIGVNIFWMFFTMYFLYLLLREITGRKIVSFGMLFAVETSVIFLDTMLLIRMYAQFTFFVILLMYLFKKNWNKKPERQFLVKLGLTLFFGMLTHYYFLLIAFFMCLVYGIKMIMSKDSKSIRNYIIALGVAGLFYGIVWYHILAHIFNGYRGKEAISKATSFGGLLSGVSEMLSILNGEAFAGLGGGFAIAIICYFIVKILRKQTKPSFEFWMFMCGVFYIVVVGKICPKITTRYIMPVGWIFIVATFLMIFYILQQIKAGKVAEYITIVMFCMLSIFNLSSRGFTVPMDYIDEKQIAAVEMAEGKEAVVFVDLKWKILYDFVILQNTKGYLFADKDNVMNIISDQSEDYILIVNLEEGRESVIQELDYELLYEDGMNYYYKVNVQ